MAKVWLITGSGNGLGSDIAKAALAAGDKRSSRSASHGGTGPSCGAIWRAGEARNAGST